MKKRKYSQSFKYRIVRDLSQFRFHDVYTSIILRNQITALKLYIGRLGINCKIMQHYRSNEIAHRWSTAYQIFNGGITLGDLRRLKNGKDEDGNIWYKRDWDPGGSDGELAKTSKSIENNAIKLGQAGMHYAEEGYEPDSPYRAPNLQNIPVSRHVHGKAIDFEIDWSQLEGAWSSKTEKIISQFGLIRPYKQEPWHFELKSNRKVRLPFYIPYSYIIRKHK